MADPGIRTQLGPQTQIQNRAQDLTERPAGDSGRSGSASVAALARLIAGAGRRIAPLPRWSK